MPTFVALLGVEALEQPLDSPIQLGDDLFLTDKQDYIRSKITKEMRSAMGKLEYGFLHRQSLFIYSDFPAAARPINSEAANVALIRWLHWLKLFFHGLWVVKDNAVECEHAFVQYKLPDGSTGLHTNHVNQRFTDAAGQTPPSPWTEDELRQAGKYFDLISRILYFREHEEESGKAEVTTALHSSSNRLDRFLRFSIQTRDSSDLAIKAAQYVTALESLLGTSTSELTFKLSLRVSFLLGRNIEDREELFATIKSAYGMRSTVVHGDSLSREQQRSLEELLHKLDSITRRLTRSLLEDKDNRKLFYYPQRTWRRL